MPLKEKQFEEYLALYGTEPEQWPEPVRTEAIRARYNATLGRLVREQQHVDETLLSHRHFEPASGDLANRIINAALPLRRPRRVAPVAWVQALLASIFPQPAIALTAMLTLGLAIGFGLPALMSGNGSDTSFMQAYMEDDGAVL